MTDEDKEIFNNWLEERGFEFDADWWEERLSDDVFDIMLDGIKGEVEFDGDGSVDASHVF